MIPRQIIFVNGVTTTCYSVIVKWCSTWPCTDARFVSQRMLADSVASFGTRDAQALDQYLLITSHLAVLLEDYYARACLYISPTVRILLICAHMSSFLATLRCLLQVMGATYMYNSKPAEKPLAPTYELVPQNNSNAPGGVGATESV